MFLVTRVIAEWDPYALLAGGAPRDEFDAEIASVATQVQVGKRLFAELQARGLVA